ncbi:uncharacterized protein TM35_000101200 [Trypanosoma theileri]|uniref:Uncharacterized protein n=1 Tax=Trypanosoma theileri TaxID=67003 RepID=A0A1X0NYT6_9TRYP|nr:uncharacterized protein TM35_000101200 [Trypanosoma theileri]ORC89852.1 hypothetical protein TM35_000101200 [Trypanosoma theileri]
MTSLRFSIFRALLRHQKLYNNILLPVFGTLHPYGVRHVFRYHTALFPYVLSSSDGKLLKLEESIQKAALNNEGPSLAITALNWLSWMENRLAHLPTKSIHHANYRFIPGEIAQICGSGERVVIALRFPVYMTSDTNMNTGVSGTFDLPWYLVIPSFSQDLPQTKEQLVPEVFLRKVRQPVSVGYNPRLPVYFEGYDMKKGVYVPRKSINGMEKISTRICI